jgi:hypothetical protein
LGESVLKLLVQRNPVRRPNRAKVATSNIRGSLAKLAGDQIGNHDNRELDDISSADAACKSLLLNGLNHGTLSRLKSNEYVEAMITG